MIMRASIIWLIFLPYFCQAQQKGVVNIKDLETICQMDSTSFSDYVQPLDFKLGQNRIANGCTFYGFLSKESEATGVYNKVSLLRCSEGNMSMFMSTNRDYFVKLKKAFIADGFVFKGKSTGSPEYSNYSKGSHKLRFYSKIELGIVSYTIQYWIEKNSTPFEPIYDLN
ncbi:MAG: hypothetical protein ACKVTZ_04310 [Bacteroidia bacterium]